MICSNCGSSVDGSKKFCHICGYPVMPLEEDLDATMAFQGEMDYANHAVERSNVNTGDDFGLNGEPAHPQPAMSDYSGFDMKPKKGIVKKLIITLVSLVLVIAIAFGAWNIYLAVNPEVKIARALKKTLLDSKSFAFEVSYDGEELAEGYLSFGKRTFNSDFYIQVENDMEIVCDDGQLLVPAGSDSNGNVSYCAVDMPELFAEIKENLDDVFYEYAGGDVGEMLDLIEDEYGIEVTPEQAAEWAETIIKNKKINEKVIKEIWNTVAVPIIAEEFDIDEKDVPDYNDVKSIIAGIFTKGISGDALKVVETYKSEGVKYYECEFVPSELYRGISAYLLECKKLEAILDIEVRDGQTVRDIIERVSDSIEDGEYPEELDEEFEITFGIKGGYLVAIEYYDFELKITDINKKHDAKKDYEDMYDDAYSVEELDYDDFWEL